MTRVRWPGSEAMAAVSQTSSVPRASDSIPAGTVHIKTAGVHTAGAQTAPTLLAHGVRALGFGFHTHSPSPPPGRKVKGSGPVS